MTVLKDLRFPLFLITRRFLDIVELQFDEICVKTDDYEPCIARQGFDNEP